MPNGQKVTTNLGRVSLVPKGEYDPGTTYERLDLVQYQDNGYVAKHGDLTGKTPTDGDDWMMLVGSGSAALAKQYTDQAKGYAESAEQSKTTAAASEAEAEQHKTDAEQSKNAAKLSETNAEESAKAAQDSAEAAGESERNAAQSAETAQQYSGNPPEIDEDGFWETWDADAQEYTSTGEKAVNHWDTTYRTVAEMQADKSQPKNTVCIISSDVEQEENARVYMWDGAKWNFLCDLSGLQGVGVAKIELTAGDHAPGTDDTYTITLTDRREYTFTVHNGSESPVLSVNGHEGEVQLAAEDVGALPADGTAKTAEKLAAPRSLKTDLGSTTAVTFDGSADQNSIPVTGTLPIGNGGTGAVDAATARTNLGITAANIGGSAILTEIEKVDGTGSGLDADLLDGHHESDFVKTASLKEYRINKNNGQTFNEVLATITNDIATFSFWNDPDDNPFSFPSGNGIALKSTLLYGSKAHILFGIPNATVDNTFEIKLFFLD